jgi:uncharacterized membrane protein
MMAITSNIMGLLLMVLILFMNPAPQAWIGVVLLLVLLAGSIIEYVTLIRTAFKHEKAEQKENSTGSEIE